LAAIRAHSELSTPPDVALQIIQTASEPGCELGDLEAILRCDPALCARLLRTVNSCLYGLRHPVTTLPAAIRWLGITPLRSLGLTLSLLNVRHSVLPREALESYWRASLTGALAMRELAVRTRRPCPEDDMVVGLLRDVGVLVLQQLYREEHQLLLDTSPEVLSAFQCALEEEAIGINHAEAGAELLRAWRLPDEITEDIRHHHDQEWAKKLQPGRRQRARHLYFSSQVAFLQTAPNRPLLARNVVLLAREYFQMDWPALRELLDLLEGQLCEIASLFQVDIGDAPTFSSVLSRGVEELTRLAVGITPVGPTPFGQAPAAPDSPQPPHPDATCDGRCSSLRCSARRAGLTSVERLQERLFPAPPSPHELGDLNGYRVQRLLGKGAVGAVFRAIDPGLDRPVAIKLLLPEQADDAHARARFLREGKAIAALTHENIVRIYAVGEKAGIPYLVMEHVEGESLADRLLREASLPLPDIIRLGLETASALAAAHARGLVHRDIKPANLLLETATHRLKVVDFGLVQTGELPGQGELGQILGTPTFMSPEQAIGGRATERSDMFSLGCVLYVTSTGRLPFDGGTVLEVLKEVSVGRPTPIRELNPALPAWLEEVVAGLLTKAPERRFPTAVELKRVLLCQWARLLRRAEQERPTTWPADFAPPTLPGPLTGS
jgi:HD-like signal output (HDOD) protein